MNTNIQSDKKKTTSRGLFIKKFKTSENYYYVYDVNSNGILKVSKVIWDVADLFFEPIEQILLDLKDKHPEEEIRIAYDTIRKAIESGVLGCHRPAIKSNEIQRTKVKGMFEKFGIEQLILDLTHRCNLRCKYCIYSGVYKYERTHSDKTMTIECALKTVDFYMAHVGPRENPAVTFYGGEAILEFALLQEVIEYIKTRQKEKKYKFALTTNGTLINEQMTAFFVENNVSLFISIDGPQDIHDRNRVWQNNAGTFDCLKKNLQRIKEYSPQYFADKVSFLSVITPPYDYDALQSFFYNNELFKSMKNQVKVTKVVDFETLFPDETEWANEEASYREFVKKIFEKYKDALLTGDYEKPSIARDMLQRFLIETVHFREITPLKEFHPALGQCTPGLRRLLVNPDGNFYMCERVGEQYSIGNLETGLDFDRIAEFHVQWDEFFTDCSECWALRFCQKCFNNLCRGDQLDKTRKDTFCADEVRTFERILSLYCEIIEENPDAFKNMQAKDYL